MTSNSDSVAATVRTSRLAHKLGSNAGAIVAVVARGSVELHRAGVGIDPGTPMEIGSVTKAFTAVLLSQLVLRNQLELSSRLQDVLGTMAGGTSDLSVESLATHTSGLSRVSLPFWKMLHRDPYRKVDRAEIVKYLQSWRAPGATPGFRYSNLGYAVLGLVLEEAGSAPYGELLSSLVLQPMRMTHTRLQCAGVSLAARGYDQSGRPARLWHWQAYSPCGGLVSTLTDVAIALQALMDPAADFALALQETVKPRAPLPNGGHIGLGWMLPDAGDSFWHNGATGGYSSYIGVDAKSEQGIIVLANQALPRETTELGTELMRLLRPRSTSM